LGVCRGGLGSVGILDGVTVGTSEGVFRLDGWRQPSPRLRLVRRVQVAAAAAVVAVVAGGLVASLAAVSLGGIVAAVVVGVGVVAEWFVQRRVAGFGPVTSGNLTFRPCRCRPSPSGKRRR
jgi:hypothetical protein